MVQPTQNYKRINDTKLAIIFRSVVQKQKYKNNFVLSHKNSKFKFAWSNLHIQIWHLLSHSNRCGYWSHNSLRKGLLSQLVILLDTVDKAGAKCHPMLSSELWISTCHQCFYHNAMKHIIVECKIKSLLKINIFQITFNIACVQFWHDSLQNIWNIKRSLIMT